MADLETIERYLRAHAQPKKMNGEVGPPRLHPFITISRQAGAGGHRLADALMDVFETQQDTALFGGWQIFDRRLCELVANHPSYSHALASLLAEEYRPRADEFFHQMLTSSVDQRAVMERVFRVVRAVASVGKAIILGRGGAEVTRDMRQGLSVRLVAPEEDRTKGVMAHYGLTCEQAREEGRRLDQARARLLKTHFRADIEDPLEYDVVFNTGRMTIEAIADAMAVMLTHRSELSLSNRLP